MQILLGIIIFELAVVIWYLRKTRKTKRAVLTEKEMDRAIDEALGEAQFIESVSFKEKFNKANNISDLL